MGVRRVLMVEILVNCERGCAIASALFNVPQTNAELSCLCADARIGLERALQPHRDVLGEFKTLSVDSALAQLGSANSTRAERVLSTPQSAPERWSVEIEAGVHVAGLFERYTIAEGGCNGQAL